jgi:hypothetical protein
VFAALLRNVTRRNLPEQRRADFSQPDNQDGFVTRLPTDADHERFCPSVIGPTFSDD